MRGPRRLVDQGFSNLKTIQKGLHNVRSGEIVLANYQELRIRRIHQTLDKYIYV